MPVELGYHQNPYYDDPGLEWDADAVVDEKTGAVDHKDSALSNLLEVVAAPLRAIMPDNITKKRGSAWVPPLDPQLAEAQAKKWEGKGWLLDVWEVVGLPVIMAKDLADAAIHGVKAGFAKL